MDIFDAIPINEFFRDVFANDLMDKECEILLRNKLEQAPFKWNTWAKNVMHSWATASWYPRINDLSVIKRLSFVSNQILLQQHQDYFSDHDDNDHAPDQHLIMVKMIMITKL